MADNPDITVYLPSGKSSGAAVLICPGGGYSVLCSSYEGHDIARWLNRYGVAGIVLKYRLSPYRHPIPLSDAKRAMRLVRSNASAWGIDPEHIGIMGFSAGGHLASTLATHYDLGDAKSTTKEERVGCRPNFMILIYPVISMTQITHGGSCANLLGANATDEEKNAVSNELHVTANTPPAFIAHSIKDSAVSVENSRIFRDALNSKGVPVEYFELPGGEHGLGCGNGPEWAAWQERCLYWMRKKQLLNNDNV